MKATTSQQTSAAHVVAAPSAGSGKLPAPCYPCKICRDEYSWPADDLYWSEKEKDWICTNCWESSYEEESEERGIRLDKEMENRRASLLDALKAARPFVKSWGELHDDNWNQHREALAKVDAALSQNTEASNRTTKAE